MCHVQFISIIIIVIIIINIVVVDVDVVIVFDCSTNATLLRNDDYTCKIRRFSRFDIQMTWI